VLSSTLLSKLMIASPRDLSGRAILARLSGDMILTDPLVELSAHPRTRSLCGEATGDCVIAIGKLVCDCAPPARGAS